MEPRPSKTFKVEHRLLMSYYPGPLGGLSDLAFQSYVMMCRGVRPYRYGAGKLPPNIVWNDFNEMTRAGGLSTIERAKYNEAVQELNTKHFVRRHPEYEQHTRPIRPNPHEVLLLPDYVGGQHKPDHGERTDAALDLRGYTMVPRKLGNHGGFFHHNPAARWAVMVKLYQYNLLVACGGVEMEALRFEHGEAVVHPSMYEELSMSRDEFMSHLIAIREQGFVDFVPAACRRLEVGGYEQTVYVSDDEDSDVMVVRPVYQPTDHIGEWLTGVGFRRIGRAKR